MTKIKVSNVANLPTKYGVFKIKSYQDHLLKEHLVIFTEGLEMVEKPLVRIHSECLTGDVFGSLKCDCGEQLEKALELISQDNGMIIYHRQEGRNIGLLNKVNAYALQDIGFDTISANHQLGFKTDERTYEIIDYILEDFGINQIKLLTNNPDKINRLKKTNIVERVPLIIPTNPHNTNYLSIKQEQMGHLL
jgi:GTP cyclohydrolase II